MVASHGYYRGERSKIGTLEMKHLRNVARFLGRMGSEIIYVKHWTYGEIHSNTCRGNRVVVVVFTKSFLLSFCLIIIIITMSDAVPVKMIWEADQWLLGIVQFEKFLIILNLRSGNIRENCEGVGAGQEWM